LFRLLVEQPWPATVEGSPGELPLTYYFGFWLPAALVGKVGGMALGWAALLAWTAVGIGIFVFLVLSLVKRWSVWPVAVFAVFGGMDLVEKALWGTADSFSQPYSVEFIDRWPLYAFTSFGDQLTTVFNQSIPAWILTALVLLQRNGRAAIALCALGLLESPLPMVGLAVIAGVLMLTGPIGAPAEGAPKGWGRLRVALTDAISPQNLAIGAACLAVFGPFFASSLNHNGLALQLPQTGTDFARLALFYVFEFGVIFALVGKGLRGSALWWTALGTMLVLPLLRLGAYNDLAMRAVIPAQVVICLLVCWTLARIERPWRSPRAAALIVVIALGAGSTLHGVYWYGLFDIRAVEKLAKDGDWSQARSDLMAKPDLWGKGVFESRYWPQYFGDPDSLFYRHLARTPSSLHSNSAHLGNKADLP
jgi:hypothetical protein